MIASLGTIGFPRLRIGVGRGDTRRDLADHVLARFEPEERSVIEDAIARAADAAGTVHRRWGAGGDESIQPEATTTNSDKRRQLTLVSLARPDGRAR